jgi:hypothetical protein
MDEKRFFEYDQVSLDAAKIETRTDKVHGPVTIFKDVVISREIIHPYTDGIAYKPAEELRDAAWTAEGMWAIAGGHPKDAVIMDRDEIQGRTVNARFSKSLIDPKTKRPNNKGIVADLEIFDNKVAPEILEDMKNGKRHDVSIGFFFHRDETPGIISEDGHPLKGGAYDYVQRKMTINHTAFALEAGRCPMPFCGVGADEIAQHIANDPFAGFKNFAECVRKNQDKENPEAYCGSIKAKTKRDACIAGVMAANPGYTEKQADAICQEEMGSFDARDLFRGVLENMRGEIDVVLSKFDDVEELKRDEEESIQDQLMSEEIDLAGLLAFYRLTEKSWDGLLDETQIILRSLWTERKKYYKDGNLEQMAGGELPPADAVLQQDEEDCEDCGEDEGQCPEGQVWNDEHNRCVPADSADESEEEDQEEKVKTVPFKATKSIEDLINPR